MGTADKPRRRDRCATTQPSLNPPPPGRRKSLATTSTMSLDPSVATEDFCTFGQADNRTLGLRAETTKAWPRGHLLPGPHSSLKAHGFSSDSWKATPHLKWPVLLSALGKKPGVHTRVWKTWLGMALPLFLPPHRGQPHCAPSAPHTPQPLPPGPALPQPHMLAPLTLQASS